MLREQADDASYLLLLLTRWPIVTRSRATSLHRCTRTATPWRPTAPGRLPQRSKPEKKVMHDRQNRTESVHLLGRQPTCDVFLLGILSLRSNRGNAAVTVFRRKNVTEREKIDKIGPNTSISSKLSKKLRNCPSIRAIRVGKRERGNGRNCDALIGCVCRARDHRYSDNGSRSEGGNSKIRRKSSLFV